MKVSVKIFAIIATFFVIMGVIYGFVTRFTEWAGFPALLALGVMNYMIAYYLHATDKKYKTGPSDDEAGEIEEYAGTYGVFAPWSWWPLGLGTAGAVCFVGLAVGWWVLIIGLVMIAFFATGWVFEFSKGQYKH